MNKGKCGKCGKDRNVRHKCRRCGRMVCHRCFHPMTYDNPYIPDCKVICCVCDPRDRIRADKDYRRRIEKGETIE